MTIRPAQSGDIDDIITLLQTHMDPAVSRDRWGQLFTYSWLAEMPDFGRVAIAGGRIVGYLGAIYSDRSVDGEIIRFVNPHSWYMEKPARRVVKGMMGGLGLEMLRDLTRDPDRHYYTSTSSRLTIALLRRVGFKMLDHSKLVWRAKPATRSPKTIEVVRDEDAILSAVEPRWRKVVEDHRTWPVYPLLVRSQGRALFVMMATSMKGDDETWHDVMSCSDPGLLAGWGQSIADAILDSDDGRFACDERFCNGEAQGAQTVKLDVARYFKSQTLQPRHFDHLYSEIQLLGQKLS